MPQETVSRGGMLSRRQSAYGEKISTKPEKISAKDIVNGSLEAIQSASEDRTVKGEEENILW